jgi:hypothetical protein
VVLSTNPRKATVIPAVALVDGLDAASIVGDDGLTESFVGYSSRHEVDEVAMLSTVRPLLAACADLSKPKRLGFT